MKRRDEVIVGATVLVALMGIVAGSIWLSESQLWQGGESHVARFRTVGGLGVGDPVVLSGVRVGRVRELRLGDGNWVDAELQIYEGTTLPPAPRSSPRRRRSLVSGRRASLTSTPNPSTIRSWSGILRTP